MKTIKLIKNNILNEKTVFIWGAGKYGSRAYSEINTDEVCNVFVYDENDAAVRYLKNYISLEEITHYNNKKSVVIIIAIKQEEIANSIMNRLLKMNYDEGQIYFYIPTSTEEYINEGYYNGDKYVRPLDGIEARDLIIKNIEDDKPFLFARWGLAESIFTYKVINGFKPYDNELVSLKDDSGFFPLTEDNIKKFSDCMSVSAKQIDILNAWFWLPYENWLYKELSSKAVLVRSNMSYPFYEENMWTKALKGKSVLVIHPFANIINDQYTYKREKIFNNSEILPKFKDIKVYQAVQSLGGSDDYTNWFDALEKMKNDISNINFDIAIIGCGAYGLPLGAFIKDKLKRQAIHMGGATQLLFGIKGNRWEGDPYNFDLTLYNESWVRADENYRPKKINYKKVENGAFW